MPKKKNAFEIRNTQYSIELSVHKLPSVFNTTYTIQSRVNCPNNNKNVTNISLKRIFV